MSRNFDIHIQLLPEAVQKDTSRFMSFGFNPTVGVRGFQMLINQWLKLFLTPLGSDPVDLDNGTEFSKLIGANLSLEDARDVVMLSVSQCNNKIIDSQRGDTSLTPSEKLADAAIIDLVEKPSLPGIEVFIEIKNQAQDRLQLSLPAFSTF